MKYLFAVEGDLFMERRIIPVLLTLKREK